MASLRAVPVSAACTSATPMRRLAKLSGLPNRRMSLPGTCSASATPSKAMPVDTSLKSPGASAVIYGGVEAKGIVFDGVDEALRVPNTELRLFGKPESFTKRRMGVALCHDADIEVARRQAKAAAAKVKPRKAG